MSGWTLKVVWPITDPGAFSEESISIARVELPGIAEGLQATLLGVPRFRTAGAQVICEVPVARRVAA